MKRIITFIFLLCLGSIFSMCSENSGPSSNSKIQHDLKTEALINADNEFGIELFRRIAASDDDTENIMVSPLSVSLALAMTYNGAGGETKAAMEKTLKLQGLTSEEINSSYQSIVRAMASLDEKVILEIANSIFYRKDFSVKEDFIHTNQTYYHAVISPLDFNSPEAVITINGWVADKTHDKITKIITEINPDHIMFLLNAIYFKGIWQTEFDENKTFQRYFTQENDEQIMVEMMTHRDSLFYFSNELFKAVEIPYGKGSYCMQVFLPEPDKSVNDIVLQLNEDNWKSWMNNFNIVEKIDLQLPKFKFKYEIKLNDVLSAMGMQIAFTNGADFSGIQDNAPLRIDYVKHKTFVEVNEEGTEAAAVTIVGIELTSIGPNEYIPFHVDRPFLFTIIEKETGAILFIAKVMHPEYE